MTIPFLAKGQELQHRSLPTRLAQPQLQKDTLRPRLDWRRTIVETGKDVIASRASAGRPQFFGVQP